jgi:4-hydroxy-tetrahydrodipicolinate synthase
MELTLNGLYVPLITPFTADGDLARGALEDLAQSALDAGAAGLVALGTTGEPTALTQAERHAVLDTLARVCRARGATLIAGAGSNDTEGSVAALRGLAEWPDVTAALTVVPYYTRPSQEGIVAHFTRLASDSACQHRPVPLVVYNIPYRTGVSLSWRTLRALAEIPGVIGVKHAVGGIDADTVRFMADIPEGFAVLGGDDAFVSPLLALGAAGGILAASHLRTADFAALIAAWHAGDVARARELGNSLAPLAAAVFAEPNPTVIKGVLHAQGRIPSPAVRLPLLPASGESVRAALDLLAEPPAELTLSQT